MRYLVVFAVLIILAGAGDAAAQDAVRVRLGDHDDYSRVVFDWDSAVPYTVDSATPGKLIIKFQKNAKPESIPAASGNVLGVDVISSDPLQLSLTIPEGARTRDFLAGNRVVVDVYDAPAGAQQAEQKPPEKSEEPKPAPQEQAAATPAPAETPAATPPAESPGNAAAPSWPEQIGANEVVLGETSGEAPPDGELVGPSQPQKEIKRKQGAKPNVITLTSTTAYGMAVFELNDQIWLINDLPDQVMSPQINGPDAAHFRPFEGADIQGGRVFRTKILPGVPMRAQGGGLVWRVLISEEKAPQMPVIPVREEVVDGQIRSGKIIWPFSAPGKLLTITDPASGAEVKVVTVKSAKQFAGPAMDYVDFRTLNSAAGIAIVPKVDDLEVKVTAKGVEISRPGGLALTSESAVSAAFAAAQRKHDKEGKPDTRRVFDFQNWQMGGVDSLVENNAIIMAGLSDLTDSGKAEGVMTLAKMYLANAQGSESLGFLNYVADELPALAENPQFIALHAAAMALDWKSEEAFAGFSVAGLDAFEEVGYWKAFALADLGDWVQAADFLPADMETFYEYPENIFNRMAPVLAEVALRAGNVKQADDILKVLEENKASLFLSQASALDYLKGESARQRGKIDETKKLWEPLTVGKDDLYRAKAGLALTRLRVEKKELTKEKSIDNLERLRYAWRGDELEAQIGYWLGRTYFDIGQYSKGLTIMRDSAVLAEGSDLGQRIDGEMTEEFANLFLGPKLDEISPLEAAALYEEFAPMLTVGPQSDKVVQRLAERLVQGDLLARAGDLLVKQIENRLSGLEAYEVTTRLAAIYLLDSQPKKALKAVDNAEQKLKALPPEQQTATRQREIALLRARAISREGRPDQALAMLKDLEKTPDANRLRADIAWNAGYWDDAAEALEDVIIDQNISLTRPLDVENTTLILHRAVALNLASDRIALANMREKYSDPMAQTDKARIFEVITRPRQSATLADRETLMGIVSEVDLFADFLKSYKSVQIPSN